VPQAEAVHTEATQPVEAPPAAEPEHHEEGEPKIEGRPGRRSWRDRVSKIFGSAAHEVTEAHAAAHDESVEEPHEAEAAADEPEIERAPERTRERRPDRRPRAVAEVKPTEQQNLGSFVIEGGHVEHEELDEEEAEMPALAEHFDRYEEGEEDDAEEANGSQFGTAVRETGEESELEDEEYDFGGEEFEESEMIADAEGEEGEEEGEEVAEGAEPAAVTAPEPGRQRSTGRFDRQRRGRRGAPPQRGGDRGRSRAHQQSRALPLISELLKEGQEILVQIAKEPIGKKGARITSHIALPGRFLVYMPTVNHIGVSRKISSEEERQRLKRIVSSERENGHGGFIVRTAASNIKEDELRADIRFLKHLWTEIRTRAESSKSPALIYHDLNLVERILRDQVTSDFSQIWVDNESEYERVVRFASRFQPSLVRRIKLYSKDAPLYEQFGINEEINKSLKSKVWLKSGGYIVINQTEALVAIDINTGKYVGKTARLEDTIVKTNCDAVKEIVRQIRLRDLGGIIVVDFIDMDERKNRQKVMQALEEAMKADRAPSKILQFNDFGLVAITRKRVKQSLERTLGTPCPYCDATGFVKSVQTICNEIYVEMRKVRRHVESKEVILRVNPEVARELKGGNGKWLQEMEELLGHPVLVKSDAQLHQEKFDMNY
jgi:ribonuclease G